MRPDRVILGEVRGEEAFDMLQAMNTGHEGSMATIHANTPRDAITRLEQMVAMGGMALSPDAIRGQIASAVGLIVQVMRLSDGKRRLTSVTEITGMEGQVVQMQEIFALPPHLAPRPTARWSASSAPRACAPSAWTRCCGAASATTSPTSTPAGR